MNDENIPYRSPVPDVMAADQGQTTEDEVNYDTLKAVKDALQKSVDDLHKDFNSFEIAKDELPAKRASLLLYQVDVRQGVYDIVAPLLETVISAMRLVDEKYKQR